MRKLLYVAAAIVVLFSVAYLAGPVPDYAPDPDIELWWVPRTGGPTTADFVRALAAREEQLIEEGLLRPEAKAHVVLADSAQRHATIDASGRTKQVIVYIHGFSASPPEGSPLIDELAARYGAHVYFMRLSDHGLTTENSFAEANPERWRDEVAREVHNATTALGDRVILVGTSTGATLALDYAARFPERVTGLVLYSPNIALANPAATLLNGPWGLQLAQKLAGSSYRELADIPKECDWIWTLRYRVEGIVALQDLLERTMTKATFERVHAPVMAAWYYRDEEHKDDIISTEAVEEMIASLATHPSQKRAHPLAEVSGHVITTDCRTTGLDRVRSVTHNFLEEVVGLVPN